MKRLRFNLKRKFGFGKRRGGGGNKNVKHVWSNSVGTRYVNPYWDNPTVGKKKGLYETKSTPEGAACLKVALNAFSDATLQPRYPDGEASESIGLKYQMINEVELRNDSTLNILLFGGLNCCAVVENGTSKSIGLASAAPNLSDLHVQRITNHVTGTVDAGQDPFNNGAVVMEQPYERFVAKWRVVSYGMLLSLVNNSEENDGWWEACRITPSTEYSDYGFSWQDIGTATTQPLTVFHVMPNMSSSEMLNAASYSTGKLRNIHNVVFQLNAEYGDHEFNDCSRKTTIFLGDSEVRPHYGHPFDVSDASGIQTLGCRLTGVENNLEENMSQFFDRNHDAIFVRIHGNAPTNTRSASKLTIHTVMNQEIIYDEKALNAKFHRGSVYHSAHDRVKGSTAAAQPNELNA